VISVVMSVHNGAPWVREAVESVLAQTASDLELVVIDDGSTDATPDILRAFGDPRLRVERQPRAGLTRSLNRALRLSTAPLVARMDADDVALPERLGRQLAFLAAHPDVGLLGTGCHEIAPSGEVLRTITPPVEDGAIRRALIRENPFVHSSIVFRRAALDRAGTYDEAFPVAQDYDLWLRMSRITRLANLPEPLVLRRLTPGMTSLARDTERIRAEVSIKWGALRSGAYPLWCAVYLVKPLVALAIPAGLRRILRRGTALG
jgi:glycosyltransferase involved in cell wall biosynthesis